ncbi:hypothetical protein SAMN05216359_101631 [Roseateles sp. YR242]|nr:hypothetical protein SAMN05216359_101631 [Roseateles sp. YR242]
MCSTSAPRIRRTIYAIGQTRLVGTARPRGAAGDRPGAKPRLPQCSPDSHAPVRLPRSRTSLKRPRPSFVA